MPAWVANIIGWLQKHLSVRAGALIATLFSSLVIFLPDDWLKYFDLAETAHKYRWAFSLTFFAGLCTLIALLACAMADGGARWTRRYFRKRKVEYYMQNLKTDELRVLLEYAQTGNNSLRLNQFDGAARGLIDKGILYVPVPVVIGDRAAFNLTAEACDLLRYKKFQELLLKSSSSQLGK
jgi:hypothetical protein